MKDTVKTSMHWATPKTERMIKSHSSSQSSFSSNNPFRKEMQKSSTSKNNPFDKDYDPPKQNTNPHSNNTNPPKPQREAGLPSESSVNMDPDEDRNLSSDEIKISKTEEVDDGITYEPTPYDMLGYRMGSPPPEWTKDELKGTNQQTTTDLRREEPQQR